MGILTRPSHFMLDGQYGVNIKSFGPAGMVGNGDPTYDGPAFQKALTYLRTNSEERGGMLLIPRGVYRPTEPIYIDNYALVNNIYIVGEGEINTQIFGDAMPDGSDIINIDNGTHFGVERMMLANAKRNGLRIKGGNLGGTGYISNGYAKYLRIQGCGSDGLYSENSYLATLDDIISVSNGSCGLNFRGFHTSLKLGRVYAANNLNGPGIQMNAAVYSSMVTCASDNNLWGYVFTNMSGFTMLSCGAESNLNENVLIRANNSSAVGSLGVNENIKGFSIIGGFFMNGNVTGVDGNASFINATAEDGRIIDVSLISNSSFKNTAHPNDKTLIGNATAGSVVRFRGTSNNFDAPNGFLGAGTAEFIGT